MRGYESTFQRYEIKYLLTHWQRQAVQDAMQCHMQPDKFGKSQICSLYFDTPDHRIIRSSIEGPVYKEKLRLRSYGTARAESTVFVELKKKYKGVVYKRRVDMTQAEAMAYLLEGAKPAEPCQITREIDYFLRFYPALAPAVYLAYARTAYCSAEDKQLRVTFDEDIRYRDTDLSLTSAAYGEPLLSRGESLMEIKTGQAIPLWLVQILGLLGVQKTSFSKYGNAYKQMLLAGKLDETARGGIRCA